MVAWPTTLTLSLNTVNLILAGTQQGPLGEAETQAPQGEEAKETRNGK